MKVRCVYLKNVKRVQFVDANHHFWNNNNAIKFKLKTTPNQSREKQIEIIMNNVNNQIQSEEVE